MKRLLNLGGIGVVILIMLIVSCCSKVRSVTDKISPVDSTKIAEDKLLDSALVEFNNPKQLAFQVAVLRQFDSLNVIVVKQGKIIDSLTKAKTTVQYVDKIVYKEKLSSKYNDKQIDSIIQSNVNLRNIIKQQNRMIKK